MAKPVSLQQGNKGVSDLARKAGISVTTASRKLGAGKTPEQIIQEAADWKAKEDAKANRRQQRSSDPTGDDESYVEAQRRKEIALADLRELELALKRADLAPVAEVNAWVAGMILKARDIFLRIGPELRDKLSQETDPINVQELIDREVTRGVGVLAEYRPQ